MVYVGSTEAKRSRRLAGIGEQHIAPLPAGLEAEVALIRLDGATCVFKIWNRESKPDIGFQYRLLRALRERGMPVSEPLAWGVNASGHQALLTSYDGAPVREADEDTPRRIAGMLLDIHRCRIDELELPRHDFVSYFFPGVDAHPDLAAELERLVVIARPRQDTFIHGDYNFDNILEAEDGRLHDHRLDERPTRRRAVRHRLVRLPRRSVRGRCVHFGLPVGFLSGGGYTADELEPFEAIALIRWMLLDRTAGMLRMEQTDERLKRIMERNRWISGCSANSPRRPEKSDMELPLQLKWAVEHHIQGMDQAKLKRDLKALSVRYRTGGGRGRRLLTEDAEAASYAIARMPATYGAVAAALKHALERTADRPATLLDCGAGTGAASWAACELLDLRAVTCLEREPAMIRLGRSLAAEASPPLRDAVWLRRDLAKDEIPERAELVIASYVLNEMSEAEREAAIVKCGTRRSGCCSSSSRERRPRIAASWRRAANCSRSAHASPRRARTNRPARWGRATGAISAAAFRAAGCTSG